MLSARILDLRPGAAWVFSGDRWRSGASWIAPYDHPALETLAVRDGRRVFFHVRERLPGCSVENTCVPALLDERAYDASLAAARDWPRGHLLAEVTEAGFTLSAGHCCPAPVYYSVAGEELHLHWDLAVLRGLLPHQGLDEVEVPRLLTLSGYYSRRTVWSAASMLTERSALCFDGTSVTVREPRPALHETARVLDEDADVVGGYERLLNAVLADTWYVPERTAVELSGGMDSSNVALSLAARHGSLPRAGALVHDGEVGAQQMRRRRELLAVTGFDDTVVRAADFPPLDPQSRPAWRLGPQEETYIAAHSRLLRSWVADGVLWVATGVGGDEMLSLTPAERGSQRQYRPPVPPWLTERAVEALADGESGIPPAPPVSDSVLRAIACGAPMYLRSGLWPLYPLADHAAWRFGQWLPVEWRRDKRLARERMARAGLSRQVTHPPLRESFHGVLQEAVQRFAPEQVREVMKGSPLLDFGFLDAGELAAAAERLERGVSAQDEMIVHVLRLHAALT
ncbi:hypothetical protein [Streptomyces werraensis]|uniref:hypothetical protein n=1 Tax=Streptomyces werraensis TaxID=68284 RepID=UPI0034336955